MFSIEAVPSENVWVAAASESRLSRSASGTVLQTPRTWHCCVRHKWEQQGERVWQCGTSEWVCLGVPHRLEGVALR